MGVSDIAFSTGTERESNSPRATAKDNEVRDNEIAACQKDVYRWFEQHVHNNPVDIYSPNWERRISSWHDWVRGTYGSAHAPAGQTINVNRKVDKNLDLRLLFFHDP